jgi:hypothetical protein
MGGWEGSSKVRGRRWRVQVSLDERVNKSGEGIHLSLLFTPPQPFTKLPLHCVVALGA